MFVSEHFDDEVKKRKNSNKNEKKRISSSLVKLESNQKIAITASIGHRMHKGIRNEFSGVEVFFSQF